MFSINVIEAMQSKEGSWLVVGKVNELLNEKFWEIFQAGNHKITQKEKSLIKRKVRANKQFLAFFPPDGEITAAVEIWDNKHDGQEREKI